MKRLLDKFAARESSQGLIPFAFLIAAFSTYALFFRQLGFYWDDLPISWIRYQHGAEMLRLYFSTSRPVWGELYQVTTRLIPQIPMYWQLFAVFWRWAGVVVLWLIVRMLWPHRRSMAFAVSLLFLLYPGFNQQWVSFLSSHFFIVLFFFLFSYLLMLWSFILPGRYWHLTLPGMMFSGLNLWMMEYFFGLELIRPFVIFFFLSQSRGSDPSRPFRQKGIEVLKRWIPYLAVFVANVFYRMFVFTNLAYQNVLLTEMRANPLSAITSLVREVIQDLWIVSVQAWGQVLVFPNPAVDGWRTTILYISVAFTVGLLAIFFRVKGEGTDRRSAWWGIGLGLIAMVVGGAPYWLAQLEITLGFPSNRFAISFMLGVSLLVGALLELLPARVRLFVSTLLVALAAGRQALWAETFKRDWTTQKNMFWQMQWRAPGLEAGTLVMMNEGALDYFADNSLGAALNWIYDPGNQTETISYAFFYPKSRLGGSLPGLEKGLTIPFTFLIGDFLGNTSQTVAFYYQPPGCLRLLDPQIDPHNRLIPDDSLMRDAAGLSSRALILAEPGSSMPDIYGPEPQHGWCYYFEKADLARQAGSWEQVARLGDIAIALDDYPNDPVERFVFIEGYAHNGDWKKAVELSQTSYKVSKNYVGPLLCKLWDRIGREVENTPRSAAAVDEAREGFECLQ